MYRVYNNINEGWTGYVGQCPFCRSGLVNLYMDDKENKAQMRCENCGARGPEIQGEEDHRDYSRSGGNRLITAAVSAWNVRRV